jgi:hypothetical protein
MLYKRLACPVLLPHEAYQPSCQSVGQIIILAKFGISQPFLQTKTLLAHLAVLPPEAITFRGRLGRHRLLFCLGPSERTNVMGNGNVP